MKVQKQKNLSHSQPTKIYYVWNYIEWGGAQIYFLSIMRFIQHKYPVKVILPENSAEKLLNYLTANEIEFEFFRGKIDLTPAETFSKRIKRRFNDYFCNLLLIRHLTNLDLGNSIVHIDVAPWSGFSVLFYLLFRAQIFLTFHTPLPKISNLRKIWWKVKFGILTTFNNFHLVASNKKVKTSLQTYISPKNYHQIEIAYSSINLAEIDNSLKAKPSREEIAKKYNLPVEKYWLCNVAQFIERKGCWVLLETLNDLNKTRQDIFFYWLGTAPLSEEIQRRVKQYNLEENFRFFSAEEIGSHRSDLLEFLGAADLFVMPSFEEGLPVALIEAMALEKCCIASEIDAIPEAIEHLKTGYLIKPNNPKSLKNAIESLLMDKSLRHKLGVNARDEVVEKFNAQILGQTMQKLYEKALSLNIKQIQNNQ